MHLSQRIRLLVRGRRLFSGLISADANTSSTSRPSSSSRPPFASIFLGGLGLTPFFFYGAQLERDGAGPPAGDEVLQRWRRHLPPSLAPILAAFESSDQAGARVRFVAYSSAILSFLGGAQFGAAFAAPPAGAARAVGRAAFLALGVLPSLVAWPAMVLASQGRAEPAIPFLATGFVGVFVADSVAVRASLLPAAYLALRAPLTLAVVGTHIFAALRLRVGDKQK
jgi:hypothetical protein